MKKMLKSVMGTMEIISSISKLMIIPDFRHLRLRFSENEFLAQKVHLIRFQCLQFLNFPSFSQTFLLSPELFEKNPHLQRCLFRILKFRSKITITFRIKILKINNTFCIRKSICLTRSFLNRIQ